MKTLKLETQTTVVPFETAQNFQSIIDQCRVSTAETQGLSLTQGLEKAVQMIHQVQQHHKKVVLIGNGGSAAIASHQAVDLWKNGGIRAVAFNDASLITCISNDYGYAEVFEKPIEMFCDSGDLIIAISSSGKSENILNGVEAGLRMGCPVITYSGFSPENPLYTMGDLNFYLPSNSYGIVEIGHLLLIHSVIDETIARQKFRTT